MKSYDFMALFFILLPVRRWTRTADNWYVALHTVSQSFFTYTFDNANENGFTGLTEI